MVVEVLGAFTRDSHAPCGTRIWRSARGTCAGILAVRGRGSCPICRWARLCM
jgi:hypothetical protein